MRPVEVVEFAAKVEDDLERSLEAERRVYPVNHNRASALGHSCVRYLTYLRVEWNQQALPDTGLQAIFRMGRWVEQATVREIQDLGYEWVWAQRPFLDNDLCISGNVDGGFSPRHGLVLPGEIKSMQGRDFDRVRPGPQGLEDLRHHPQHHIRGWPTQLSLYIYLTGAPGGVLILRDKWYWRMRVVPFTREQAQPIIDEALEKARTVNASIAAGTLPDRIEYSDKVCGRCAFKSICLPARSGEGVVSVRDEDLIRDLEERSALESHAKRHEELTESIKAAVKDMGSELLVDGRWVVTNKEQHRKRLAATGEEYTTNVTSIRELDTPLVPLRGNNEGGK